MIAKNILEKINEVIYIVDGESDDWFKIKKLIVNSLPPKDRKNFTRRHDRTKKSFINDFEREVMEYWAETTGQEIYVNPNKLQPDDWDHFKVRCWRIIEMNYISSRKKWFRERPHLYTQDILDRELGPDNKIKSTFVPFKD
jgi:hypothetical protein